MIRLTPAAISDLEGISISTAATWGPRQAEAYLEGLIRELDLLLEQPGLGREVNGMAGTRVLVYRHHRRSQGYGHRVFYRVDGSDIEVVRVLHSALNWEPLIYGD